MVSVDGNAVNILCLMGHLSGNPPSNAIITNVLEDNLNLESCAEPQAVLKQSHRQIEIIALLSAESEISDSVETKIVN